MTRVITILLVSVLSISATTLSAQNKKQAPCSTKAYTEFDFWVGDWNVYNAKNKLIGTNHIVKMANACAIQENWKSKTSNSQGTSYNYYNAIDKSWNQVWVDNAGGSLVLKGKYTTNKMVLKSALIQGKKKKYYNQITWTKNPNGTVTQLWELRDENHAVFNELFRGIYKKITK